MGEQSVKIPQSGIPKDEVLKIMEQIRDKDANWCEGRTWSLVYHASEEHTDFLKSAYTMFFSENGLNPMAFPSLKKFEAEVISMTADSHTRSSAYVRHVSRNARSGNGVGIRLSVHGQSIQCVK